MLNGKWRRLVVYTIPDLYGCFQKIGVPPKWMVKTMENPIKIDDLGVPLFLETPI